MHKPIGCFKNYQEYASEETNPETDYRTEKEKREDYADYLRDRAMDWQHELKERDMGAR